MFFCLSYAEQQIAVSRERPVFCVRNCFRLVTDNAKLCHLLKYNVADHERFFRDISRRFKLDKSGFKRNYTFVYFICKIGSLAMEFFSYFPDISGTAVFFAIKVSDIDFA